MCRERLFPFLEIYHFIPNPILTEYFSFTRVGKRSKDVKTVLVLRSFFGWLFLHPIDIPAQHLQEGEGDSQSLISVRYSANLGCQAHFHSQTKLLLAKLMQSALLVVTVR
ncbi:hypothetical protein TNCT_231131 [Trichonephila clavata]|uniref:Uncharacterized protein n=1 Tax=Trichonephila clavata TaxID=2740835 RepID=A0A8X6KIV5_TRICU|nr:hypothetical protein TNCT_231131 [Trichonephila clavata]